jgi:hypothetical protein
MSATDDDRAPPADDAEVPEAPNEDVLAAGLAQLDQRGRSGADWFFWIAALSLINTAITHSGGDRHFIVGMGITQIVDVIAAEIAKQSPEAKAVIVGVAIAFSVVCSLVAAVVGYLSRNRWQVIFGLGMFVYLLDGLLFVLVQDWMSAGFHGFALFCMWGGFSAFRQLAVIEKQLVTAGAAAT